MAIVLTAEEREILEFKIIDVDAWISSKEILANPNLVKQAVEKYRDLWRKAVANNEYTTAAQRASDLQVKITPVVDGANFEQRVFIALVELMRKGSIADILPPK